jgi:hypothetical protein
MSGTDQEPPTESDLSPEEIAEISAALIDALAVGRPPEIASSVIHTLGISEDKPDLGALLRQAQDDLPAPELVASVLKTLGLSDDVSEIGPLLKSDSEASIAQNLDHEVIAQVEPGAETLELSAVIRESLSDPHPVDLRSDIFTALGLTESSEMVGELLRESVLDHEAPDLADAVMSTLGLNEELSLGDLLGPETAPDLWSAIEADIAQDQGSDSVIEDGNQEVAPVVSFEDEREKRRSWLAPASIWAAAAAALIFVVVDTDHSSVSDVSSASGAAESTDERFASADPGASESAEESIGSELNDTVAASSEDQSSSEPELSEGEVVIEELDSEANAFVQVLQFEEDAPPIIFITELDEISDDGSNEATL